jgi:hypothetical protein
MSVENPESPQAPDMRAFWRLAFQAGVALLVMLLTAYWLGEL